MLRKMREIRSEMNDDISVMMAAAVGARGIVAGAESSWKLVRQGWSDSVVIVRVVRALRGLLWDVGS